MNEPLRKFLINTSGAVDALNAAELAARAAGRRNRSEWRTRVDPRAELLELLDAVQGRLDAARRDVQGLEPAPRAPAGSEGGAA